MVWTLARFLADAINPLFLLLILLAPLTGKGAALSYYLRSIVAIFMPVVLAEAGKKWQVWHGHYGFPSGHTTFALAAATCLVCRDPRWLPVAFTLSILMGWSLIQAGYHTPEDVMGATILGAGGALLIFHLSRPGREK